MISLELEDGKVINVPVSELQTYLSTGGSVPQGALEGLSRSQIGKFVSVTEKVTQGATGMSKSQAALIDDAKAMVAAAAAVSESGFASKQGRLDDNSKTSKTFNRRGMAMEIYSDYKINANVPEEYLNKEL